ncbi:MAG TPA: C-terminal binding protein [Rhodospirillales bacterium]|jgi:D-3-phosphoglycerate dehydrogenase|nr:C-terminal binding protein [Rhodospirillales bacterium]|tara:strand:+ start:281 stop:1264 length:984 start_codon:yes stop_codon:yes gene_type:complete
MIIGVTDHYRPPFDIEDKALGGGVEFIDFNSRNEDDFDAGALRRVDALLVFHARITGKTIEKLDNCKIIVRYGVGVDNMDLEALKKKGIPLCNTPDYGVEEIAATAAAHILNLWRRISAYDQACRGYRSGWAQNIQKPIARLSEGTLGVVGTGRIGTALIGLMKPFGCRVIGFDKYQPPGCERGAGYKRAASLKELLAASDAISLHCLLTEETAGMVDEAFLGAMKPGAILVNTARGGLFKNLDVIEAGLRSGQLGGLGTDVLPAEPPGEHPLIDAWRGFEPWLKGRLVITPHTAYYSESALYDMRHKAAETVVLFFNTNELRNRIV